MITEKQIQVEAEKYYWSHSKLHETSKAQYWLKSIVEACYIDGYRNALTESEKDVESQKKKHIAAGMMSVLAQVSFWEENSQEDYGNSTQTYKKVCDWIRECLK